MNNPNTTLLDRNELRQAIREEYDDVAKNPKKGFHFNTGRSHAMFLGYDPKWLNQVPQISIDAFAGMGNPFSLGKLNNGERVVDIGCGAGIDSLIAARMIAHDGEVIGIDMTPAMIDKARESAEEAGLKNVEFRLGYGESLPIEDSWADVIISNGVLNLYPDKTAGLQEMARVLKPTGRLQIADILVQKTVPNSGKLQIDLWTG